LKLRYCLPTANDELGSCVSRGFNETREESKCKDLGKIVTGSKAHCKKCPHDNHAGEPNSWSDEVDCDTVRDLTNNVSNCHVVNIKLENWKWKNLLTSEYNGHHVVVISLKTSVLLHAGNVGIANCSTVCVKWLGLVS
jgi:hypothetical protein